MSYKRMIQAVETHSGEPMRVITGGVAHIPGDSVYEQMRWLERNDDQLRLGIRAECRDGKVKQVTFENVPAFAVYRDAVLDVPQLGAVTVDVAWGGMFYVIADVTQFASLDLVPDRGRDITRMSALILKAAQDQLPVEHPDYPGIGITIAQLSGPTDNPDADRRNAVTVASGPIDLDDPATWTGGIDRCPCGTGTCAKMAALYDKGYCTYVLDADDPYPNGFTIGDIWAAQAGRLT